MRFLSQVSYWLLSSEVAVFRDSFVIISCRFLFVKRFFEVFWKSFLRKLSASQQTFHRTSQTLFNRIVHRYNFQASRSSLDWGLNPCLTRQLVYNTTGRKICQRFFEDLERWVKIENFRVGICGNSCIAAVFYLYYHRFWGQAHLIFLIEFAQQIRNASLSGRRALQVSKGQSPLFAP